MPDNFEVKYAKAQLKTSSEYVDQKTAEGNDPTPAAFRIVVLAKCRWFSMTFEGWNDIMVSSGFTQSPTLAWYDPFSFFFNQWMMKAM